MSAMLDTKLPRGAAFGLERLLVIAGLLVLYVPSFQDLGTSLWQSDEHAHGPIVLAVIVWLIVALILLLLLDAILARVIKPRNPA